MQPPIAPGPMVLLKNADVQQELSLTTQQKAGIESLFKKISEAFKKDFRPSERPSPELRRKLASAAWAELPTILNAAQQKRLREIEYQQRGTLHVLMDPAVQQSLGLTSQQVDQLNAVANTLQNEMSKISRPPQPAADAQPNREVMIALRKQSIEKAVAVLSESQSASVREMLGTPFPLNFGAAGPGHDRAGAKPAKPTVPSSARAEGFDDL